MKWKRTETTERKGAELGSSIRPRSSVNEFTVNSSLILREISLDENSRGFCGSCVKNCKGVEEDLLEASSFPQRT